MGLLGTVTPYPVGDILAAVTGTIGTQSGLQVFSPSVTVQTLHTFTAGSGGTGTATSGSITGLGPFKDADVIVNVTAVVGAATNTLIVFLDARLDGTNWYNVANYAVITTVGQYIAHVTKRQSNTLVPILDTVDAGAGTIRPLGFGDAIRVRRQITGTATTSFTGSVLITNLVQ